MKPIIGIIISFLSFHALATEPLVFSTYDKSIQLVGAKDNFDAQFKGQIKITGMLLVDFERDDAYFFPNEKSLDKLPNVVEGRFPKKADSIWIGSGSKLINQLLTKKEIIKLLVNREDGFESAAVVTIKNIRTQVACDSRVYEAELVFVSLRPNETEVIKAGHGC